MWAITLACTIFKETIGIYYLCEDGSGNVLRPVLSEIMVVTIGSNETYVHKGNNIRIVHEPTTLICVLLYNGNYSIKIWICWKN